VILASHKGLLYICQTSSWTLLYCSESYLQTWHYWIESVQRRFTKRSNGLCDLAYSCRLARLDLDSLYCRRVEYDFIISYKMLNNLVYFDPVQFLNVLVHVIQCVTVSSFMCHITSARDGRFLTNHVINSWNSLPDHTVTSSTVACCEHKLKLLNFCL